MYLRMNPLTAIEGKPLNVECRSAAGRPASRMSWALANDREAQQILGYLGMDNIDLYHGKELPSSSSNPSIFRGPNLIGRAVNSIKNLPVDNGDLSTVTGELRFVFRNNLVTISSKFILDLCQCDPTMANGLCV